MDLALLRTFVAVHRAGSFTRAAALLGLSQPAVTSQIRTLERQLGRPLFHRRARGVTPTAVGDELAHKAAPHLDALLRITEAEREAAGALRTLHLAGPPEFLCVRVLPALAPLVGQGHTLRTVLQAGAEETLDGLAAGHHDLVVTTARPRGGLFSATALCDEEHVLVAAPYWAPSSIRTGCARPARSPSTAFRSSRSTRRCRSSPATVPRSSRPGPAPGPMPPPSSPRPPGRTGVRPGRSRTRRPASVSVPGRPRPRQIVALLEPPVPPLRTWFLVVRTGSLALAHLARAHDRLLRAAAHW